MFIFARSRVGFWKPTEFSLRMRHIMREQIARRARDFGIVEFQIRRGYIRVVASQRKPESDLFLHMFRRGEV